MNNNLAKKNSAADKYSAGKLEMYCPVKRKGFVHLDSKCSLGQEIRVSVHQDHFSGLTKSQKLQNGLRVELEYIENGGDYLALGARVVVKKYKSNVPNQSSNELKGELSWFNPDLKCGSVKLAGSKKKYSVQVDVLKRNGFKTRKRISNKKVLFEIGSDEQSGKMVVSCIRHR